MASDGKQLKPFHFKPGQSGNPSGISKEARLLQVKNAEGVGRVRELMLAALLRRLEAATANQDDALALAHISNEINKFMADTEARGLGAPKQDIEMSGGLEKRKSTFDVSKVPTEALEALLAARRAAQAQEENDDER